MSAWLQRGFLYSTRLAIANEIVLANAPFTLLEAVMRSNPKADVRVASRLVLNFIRAARRREDTEPKRHARVIAFPEKTD